MEKKMGPEAKSTKIVARGVRNLDDVGELMSATICDLLSGKISVSDANKLTTKTGKFLRQYENELKRQRQGQ